jgi:bud site selection protein 20
MGGPYKRKKYHRGDVHLKRRWRVKMRQGSRTKDLDQIDQDLSEGVVGNLLEQNIDFDKAGLGQFYCVHCAKDFIDTHAFRDHVKSKVHKRRLHALKTEPYTIEEANRAAGMGSYVKPGKRKMDTLLPSAVVAEETLADVKKRAKLDDELQKKLEDEALEKAVDDDGDVNM